MEDAERQHVVLFPFMAQGHITPFLALAGLLRRRCPNLIVTLVSTPRNIQKIKSSSCPPSLSSVRLRSIPFSPAAHGLPPEAETTAAIPFHQIVTLLQASQSLQPAFEQLIDDITQEDGRPPLCIIADNFFAWSAHVARRFGAFHAIFFTSGAYGTAVYSSLWTHLPHRKTNSDEFPLPEFPDTIIHRSQLPKHLLIADGTDPWSDFLQRQISLSSETDAVIINTVEEVEKTGLRMLCKVLPCPIWPIGPVLSSPSSDIAGNDYIMKWLDSQPPASVLYISFGSQNTIAAPQMMELAMGLEASRTRFLWVIRPPVGFDLKGEFKAEWLPEKFEERMRGEGTGVLVHGWAPQLEILSHTSTGGFLSHCGWNSVLESLSRGVPIVAWPLSGDQLYNAKMMEEELGVCVEVARGNMESSKADRVVVERVVKEVMHGGQRGKEIRRKVEEVRGLMKEAWREGPGSSVKGLSEFFRAAASMRGAGMRM
ncbi:hypothetical protein GW17_00057266 [Ensete ventricosum]|uniref:Glycosyltransferase n=1 Tax=Ensete ventricosum TaxID=4639 RepID=A0A444C630_ENSVE|nr:hypothetical protein B296_00047715 [Ensete ventricosum]RWV81325.1 hypothetical protein GW17_00057266 [Ensete ventricosum]